jgi:hypothetical protein
VFFLKEHNNNMYRLDFGHYDVDSSKDMFFEVGAIIAGKCPHNESVVPYLFYIYLTITSH